MPAPSPAWPWPSDGPAQHFVLSFVLIREVSAAFCFSAEPAQGAVVSEKRRRRLCSPSPLPQQSLLSRPPSVALTSIPFVMPGRGATVEATNRHLPCTFPGQREAGATAALHFGKAMESLVWPEQQLNSKGSF